MLNLSTHSFLVVSTIPLYHIEKHEGHPLAVQRNTSKSRMIVKCLTAALVLSCITGLTLNKIRLQQKETASPRLTALPRTMIWAWERPEHLTFINPRTTGVAFLSSVIHLIDDDTIVDHRQQTMSIPLSTSLMGVIRIEASNSASLSDKQLDRITKTVANTVTHYALSAVQIDFDARVSERLFYKRLLQKIRNQIPQSTALSMTALASWCISDYWIGDLPVDEVVPMYFSMGIDQKRVLSHLRTGRRLASRRCERASGVMVNGIVAREAMRDRRLRSRLVASRLYLFSSRPWSEQTFNRTMSDLTVCP